MKKALFIALVGLGALSSCDHVENPYPSLPPLELDFTLYPNGGQAEYVANEWPTFSANTNTDRNVLIEDFTGHRCVACPAAADNAHNAYNANPGRVFISSVHTGPAGSGSLQAIVPPLYLEDFTCEEGEEIGQRFGNDWPGSPFFGNPSGTVSRYDAGNGFPIQNHNDWGSIAATLLSANDLKVNLQAESNYYPSTRGIFLHTEIEVLDAALTELNIVVQLMEDSMVAPQVVPGSDSLTYVHRDIMRACIDGRAMGQALDANHLDETNGKYYFDYSYALPLDYEADNAHLLIYVRDAITEEIYHVIEEHIE